MLNENNDERQAIIEERLRKAKKMTADAKRRRDTHVKCIVAGELLKKLKISNIAMDLNSYDEQEAFLQFMQKQYFERLKYNDEAVTKFSVDCKKAVEKAAK